MGTKGRFKRSLFGYRPGDVDEAIAKRDAQLEARRVEVETGEGRIRELERGASMACASGSVERERVSAWLAERVVERERELRELRAELARARERGEESQRTLTTLADDLEGVRRQARGQATRIRLRALREAAELTERIGELGRSAGRSARAVDRVAAGGDRASWRGR